MHDRSSRSFRWVLLTGFIILLLSIYFYMTIGEFDLSLPDIVQTLLRIEPQPDSDLIVFEFRLPRLVIAALVGFGLAIAGATVQGVTRNGLADPGILGIHAGAGAAIVLYMYAFQGHVIRTGWTAIMTMPLFGLVGGMAAAALLFVFAWHNGRLDAQRLILTGIALGSGFGAISLFLSLRMNAKDFEMATVWLTGSIWNANWIYIVSMLPWFILLVPLLMLRPRILDLFQLDENLVRSLGLRYGRELAILLLCSIGLVSACVSVSGSISFVGLLAPHIARRLVGAQHRYMMPICGLIGTLLVIISDLIAKSLFAPAELPVGIVISIVGVPYFLFLLYKSKSVKS
ncbi:iron ABC transporter permease [Paenibacillus sp. RC67]|uniref:FecCD family ABC transporter permease n=1 Tax=Paenibacillus sp. RC67 TaxID=3039392 RepID=UPI0024AD1895|nr:iron ABC transporter permease [Paenibacillus sp. RC67]